MAKFENRFLTPIQGFIQSKIEKAKNIMEVDFKTFNLSFLDYLKTFPSQDMAKRFFFNCKNCIFFIILKLQISIQLPKYKLPYLKYKN